MGNYKTDLRSEEEQRAEAERQLRYIDEIRELVGEISENLGRPLYSCVVTFGCQMNLEILTTCG